MGWRRKTSLAYERQNDIHIQKTGFNPPQIMVFRHEPWHTAPHQFFSNPVRGLP
jgi:hypothetical protein